MSGRRGIGSQPAGTRGDAPATRFEAQSNVAGDQHANQIRHGSTGHKQTAGALGKAEDRLHPKDNLALHFDRDVVAAAEIRVEAGGEHLGLHALRDHRENIRLIFV